jgi:hypothetical protein
MMSLALRCERIGSEGRSRTSKNSGFRVQRLCQFAYLGALSPERIVYLPHSHIAGLRNNLLLTAKPFGAFS